eukprot:gene1540-2820_t
MRITMLALAVVPVVQAESLDCILCHTSVNIIAGFVAENLTLALIEERLSADVCDKL